MEESNINDGYDRRFFKELVYLFYAHRKYSTQKFAELGLTTGQPKVLTILLEQEGYVQKDLADRCMVEPATMTSLLNRMEKNELIRKESIHVTSGKRAMAVYLTDKGRKLAYEVRRITAETDGLALTGLTKEEIDVLYVAMDKARVNIEEKLDFDEKTRKRLLWEQVTSTKN